MKLTQLLKNEIEQRADGDFGFISGKAELTLCEKFGFCRIFFRADTEPTEAEILLDGKSEKTVKILADCNREMTALLETVPSEEREKFLYHDDWHPNATGHALYEKQIFPLLEKLMR